MQAPCQSQFYFLLRWQSETPDRALTSLYRSIQMISKKMLVLTSCQKTLVKLLVVATSMDSRLGSFALAYAYGSCLNGYIALKRCTSKRLFYDDHPYSL